MIRWLLSQVHKEGIRRRKSRQRGLSGSLKSEREKICMEPTDLAETGQKSKFNVCETLSDFKL